MSPSRRIADELQGIRRGEWTTIIEVNDDVAIRLSGGEHEGVVARAADERVVAGAAVEHVGATLAVEHVVAGIAVQLVGEQIAIAGEVACPCSTRVSTFGSSIRLTVEKIASVPSPGFSIT